MSNPRNHEVVSEQNVGQRHVVCGDWTEQERRDEQGRTYWRETDGGQVRWSYDRERWHDSYQVARAVA